VTKSQTVSSKKLKAFLDANKRETRLLGYMERHMLAQPFDERSQDVLHPSDIIKPEWCALAAYHALNGNYVEVREKPTLRLSSIFSVGHSVHAKWQGWLNDMASFMANGIAIQTISMSGVYLTRLTLEPVFMSIEKSLYLAQSTESQAILMVG
jgi:hypothetical protein